MNLNLKKEAPAAQDFADVSRQSLAEIAAETWRLHQSIDAMLVRMDPMDAERFLGQYRWFSRKISAALAKAGIQLVDLTGHAYSVGMAASALNMDEFDDEDELEVEQMIEPIIMCEGHVMKTGSVLLRRKA